MKGVKTHWKVSLALLASAALAFGQMNGVRGPVPQHNAAQSRMIAPGTINYVEGQVSLDNQAIGQTGMVAMQPGQTLSTGNGFAEVLLTPGSFLRVGHNSEIRLVTAGLADTKAQLNRGVALVEVDQLIKGTNLAVMVGGATAQIEKKGLYDIDADQHAVKVLDGRATVLEAAGSKSIGKNDQLLLASDRPLKSSGFDSNAVKAEPLYVWSQARSQNESQANVEMAQNVAAYGGWYGSGWYWNPYASFYSYLPAVGYLYSPFGWGFYSPAFIGYYGVPFGYYGRYYGGFHGRVGGFSAHVSAFHGGGRR